MDWNGIDLESPGQRIGVFRALQLGDLLCAVPTFRALRAAFPEAEISLIGLPWAETFVERFEPFLNHFIGFPGHPMLPEQPVHLDQVSAFLETTQAQHFDLILQMHGAGRVTNALIGWMGARLSAGFFSPGEPCPNPRTFLVYPEDLPEIWRGLSLLSHLGIPPQGDELEFPIFKQDRDSFQILADQYGLVDRNFAVIHPGASIAAKRWPVESFASVGDWLTREGLKVVLTGVAGERPITAAVMAQMKAAGVDLTGQTDLGTLAVLLEKARLLICNDTGISHIGAALKIPSVVLFSGSEWRRWAPLDHELHRVITEATLRPPDEVIRAARLALETERIRVEQPPGQRFMGIGSDERSIQME
jgi:ADP-heptose:LPS heptosyltransferase